MEKCCLGDGRHCRPNALFGLITCSDFALSTVRYGTFLRNDGTVRTGGDSESTSLLEGSRATGPIIWMSKKSSDLTSKGCFTVELAIIFVQRTSSALAQLQSTEDIRCKNIVFSPES